MDILSRKPPMADHRVPYGAEPSQFGDLWLPQQPTKLRTTPVIVFFHGGWWQSDYDLAYGGHLCAALRAEGLTVWSVEYRRVGEPGGGWPGTFQDAGRGFDYLSQLAKIYTLDLSRVVAVGHSAGATLAFWQAGRHHIDTRSTLHEPQPKISVHGLVSLAGAVDLRLTVDLAGYFSFAHDRREVFNLMGGAPKEFEERYRAANPGDLLPLNVKQVLIQGTEDQQIPAALAQRWADNARRQGDEVTVKMVPGADHFDVVDPQSAAWPTVRDAVLSMLV